MRRAVAGAFAVLAVLAPSANAAPRKTLESVRYGFFETSGGVGCSTASISSSIGGSGIVRVKPEEGESVGIDAEVLAVDVTDGRVRWTIGPDRQACSLNDSIYGPGAWRWETWQDASWRLLFRERLYAIRATTSSGIRSIAGFRVVPRGRSYSPTLARARRALGRPSSVRRGRRLYRNVCWARWNRIGLRATFVNFGLGAPCRKGPLQLARVEGPAAARWVAAIGTSPGFMAGTSLDYLEELGAGDEDVSGRRLWTLAHRYLPYGTSGFVPTVSAVFTGSGRLRGTDLIRGFDLYIGAAGD